VLGQLKFGVVLPFIFYFNCGPSFFIYVFLCFDFLFLFLFLFSFSFNFIWFLYQIWYPFIWLLFFNTFLDLFFFFFFFNFDSWFFISFIFYLFFVFILLIAFFYPFLNIFILSLNILFYFLSNFGPYYFKCSLFIILLFYGVILDRELVKLTWVFLDFFQCFIFKFFFQFYHLKLDYWVLSFLIFYALLFLWGYLRQLVSQVILDRKLVKLTRSDLDFFPKFFYLFNFNPFF
jgi:hypothetical protein